MECTPQGAAATGARAAAATAPQNPIFVCTGQHLQAPTAIICFACVTAHSCIQTRNCSVLLAHAAAASIFRAKYQRAGAVIGFTADSGWCDLDALFVCGLWQLTHSNKSLQVRTVEYKRQRCRCCWASFTVFIRHFYGPPHLRRLARGS